MTGSTDDGKALTIHVSMSSREAPRFLTLKLLFTFMPGSARTPHNLACAGRRRLPSLEGGDRHMELKQVSWAARHLGGAPFLRFGARRG
jgi:hypothetical protein